MVSLYALLSRCKDVRIFSKLSLMITLRLCFIRICCFLSVRKVLRNRLVLFCKVVPRDTHMLTCQVDPSLSMLVDLNQWWAAIGVFSLSLPSKTYLKIFHHIGFVPLFLSLVKSCLFCSMFVLISGPILPLTATLHFLAAQFFHSEKLCFLHLFTNIYFHAPFLIYFASEMIVSLPGIANVTLLQNGHILIELTHGYGYAYVVCQTCYLLCLFPMDYVQLHFTEWRCRA